jgi:uncharacterized iron-regulated membrane protein
MRRLARWHIWLGWLVAVPLLLWTVSGLVMVARPIEEVRGKDLRLEGKAEAVPAGFAPALPFLAPGQPAVSSYAIAMRHSIPVARVTYADQRTALFDARNGTRLTPLDQAAALEVVRRGIVGASRQTLTAKLFAADAVPFDFRQPMPVWQVTLRDGTHVYVGRDTGAIEAVRTRFWRLFDFMWGLHIMDPQAREDTHHPLLIISAVLALFSVVFGTALLFRRRKAVR